MAERRRRDGAVGAESPSRLVAGATAGRVLGDMWPYLRARRANPPARGRASAGRAHIASRGKKGHSIIV